jgi:hypothetical protein
MLAPEFLARRSVRVSDDADGEKPEAKPQYDDKEEGEIIDRLKGLGYIS